MVFQIDKLRTHSDSLCVTRKYSFSAAAYYDYTFYPFRKRSMSNGVRYRPNTKQ